MKPKSLDRLNILLIVVCLLLAFKIPFEMFFFMYAFLGPLHYLTEMNWLKDKKFFVQKNNINWVWLLFVFAAFASLRPTLKFIGVDTAWLDVSYMGYLVLCFFLFSASIVIFKKTLYIILSFVSGMLLSLLVYLFFPKDGAMVIATLVPTTIHVFLFTGLFMLYGAMKSKSKLGYWSVAALFVVPIIILLVPIDPVEYYPSEGTKDLIENTGVSLMVYKTAYIMQLVKEGDTYHPLLVYALKIKIFFAFAYTYHYLNWFSKTTVIGWSKSLTKRNSLIIGIIWIAGIVLYKYDYNMGLLGLFFLSYLHVVLEFPLNVVTIREIFKTAKA